MDITSLFSANSAAVARAAKNPFLSYEQEGEEELEGFDPFLYSKLLDARSLFMKMVQNRNLPIMNRIMLCLGLALDMQNRVKSRQLFSCDEVFLPCPPSSIISTPKEPNISHMPLPVATVIMPKGFLSPTSSSKV